MCLTKIQLKIEEKTFLKYMLWAIVGTSGARWWCERLSATNSKWWNHTTSHRHTETERTHAPRNILWQKFQAHPPRIPFASVHPTSV